MLHIQISIVSLPSVFDDFQYPRVQPIVTPRFPLSCSETLLGELGNLAKARDLHIQVGVFLLFVPMSRPARLLCTLNSGSNFIISKSSAVEEVGFPSFLF